MMVLCFMSLHVFIPFPPPDNSWVTTVPKWKRFICTGYAHSLSKWILGYLEKIVIIISNEQIYSQYFLINWCSIDITYGHLKDDIREISYSEVMCCFIAQNSWRYGSIDYALNYYEMKYFLYQLYTCTNKKILGL